ncbi:hypothetical protein ACF0H5_015919 [Mactra antiquata]
MEGTFRSGSEKFLLSPVEDNALGRVKRNANRLWSSAAKIVSNPGNSKSKIYAVYKTEKVQGTATDFKEDTPIELGRVAAFGKETKIVRENVLPGGRKYNLEILAVIDYGLYERFYKASNEPTEFSKDNDAKYKLKKYFSHVFNGVDMLYQGIDDPNFSMSVGVSEFIIADSPDVSPWTTPHIDKNPEGRHDLLVSIPLDELLSWSFSARNIPENDHIMLLTDYDLYSNDGGRIDKRTAGYARVGSVCMLDSVSVIEDHGGFQSINAAAHELGHGLGSRHDGKLNGCDPNAMFIMTAHGGFETEATKSNPWSFSKCSVQYFKDYIAELPPRHCLTDPIDIFDKEEYQKFVSTYPGQDYTPNEQCQDILGLDSYYGWGPELGVFSDICTEMSCKVPGASRSYRVYKAATGTSCGDKMWCLEGQCTFDEKAPTKDPQCVFGDTQRRFGSSNQSCRQYMLANPMRCYDSFYRTRCCETCEKLNTGVPGCEYGDHYLNCQSRMCFDPSYANDCCSTCGKAPHPVIRTEPVTRPTTTTTTTTTTQRPTTTTRRPTTPRRTTTRRPVITWRPTTRRPVITWRPTTPRPVITWRPSTRRPIFTWRPTTPRPIITWGPITNRPTTTRRPAVTTTRRPVIITTKRPTTTESPVKPSGKSGLCLRMNARFLLVFKCSSLTSLFGQDACENSLVARYCCERCPGKGEEACEDTPECKVRYARQCYLQSNKNKCCRTCRKFETGETDCEYGDKIGSCDRHVGKMGLSAVCKRYSTYCCGVCSALASTNNITQLESQPKPSSLPVDVGVVKIGRTRPSEKVLPTESSPGRRKGNNFVVPPGKGNNRRNRNNRGNKGRSNRGQGRPRGGGNNRSTPNDAPRFIIPSSPVSGPDNNGGINESSRPRVVHRFVLRPNNVVVSNRGRPTRRFNFVISG